MKIKKIILNNIGPFAGINELSFDVSDPERNVVLIGGKNGAGKTTLCNAIRIGLYGAASMGYVNIRSEYLTAVDRLINADARRRNWGTAYVEIALLLDDGMDDYTYTFHREWIFSGESINEKFALDKEGIMLTDVELDDFRDYLMSCLPPSMLYYCFFDGERIGDFTYNGADNDFRKAFLKLTKLDSLEECIKCFERVSRQCSDVNGSKIHDNYEACKNEIGELENSIAVIEADLASRKLELEALDEAAAQLERDYRTCGGITTDKKDALLTELAEEEWRRKYARERRNELADTMVPLYMIRDLIEELRDQIVDEMEADKSAALIEEIRKERVAQAIDGALGNVEPDKRTDVRELIIDAIIKCAEDDAKGCERKLKLSRDESVRLLREIDDALAFDPRMIDDEMNVIEESLKKSEIVREKLNNSTTITYDSYCERRGNIFDKKLELESIIMGLQISLEAANDKLAKANSRYSNAEKQLIEHIRKESVGNIALRGYPSAIEIRDQLYKRYIHKTETEFSEFFGDMINKTDLMDGIRIDGRLNVTPYKECVFNKAALDDEIKDYGAEAFVRNYGSYAFEEYGNIKYLLDMEEVTLPVELKKNLSAGEKQIFIMALYKALAQLNRIEVPYIIDTPFARIDKDHRSKILTRFIGLLGGQVIILSTDEEVVGECYDTILPMLSNRVLLQHESDGTTRIIPGAYFE